MSWLGRMFAGDEELGKKNDDHRPKNGNPSSSSWSARKQSPAFQRRRVFYGICTLLLVYVFIQNVPIDLGPSPRSTPSAPNIQAGKLNPESRDPPTKKPKRPATPSEAEEHYHDGPIKFYMLALSLHGVARLGGQHELNKNVLFAASNLKSASELIPMACEMARWERNDVHFAIMGRDDMDIREIKKLNGAEEGCNVHWHDARPDYSRWSSDFRMEVSVTASMEHIHTFIHPQVIMIDDPNREDKFFVSALRSKAMDIGRGIIELPSDALENMMWLTRLDSGSLAAWTATYVDILILALPDSSGSLVRLLKSIENADYFGIRRPHLTIELPINIDPPTWRYLENLVWPPLDWSGAPHASQVSLRHRIPRRTSTEHEASARLVESFYPVRTGNSHVLVLSPQVELSPLYYHYLIYNLLEYKYSAYGAATTEFPNLMGFSLELPSFHLNDTEPLKPPLMKRTPLKGNEKGLPGEPSPFLWQAPNANAALYFGDKWMEFHSFLSARLTKPPSARRKVFSNKHPAWQESLLELIRARGYSMLYPNFPAEGDAIATIHDELYQVPEEYPKNPTEAVAVPELNLNEPLTTENEKRLRAPPPNTEHQLLESNLLSLLPNSGDLPEVSNLPLISYNGISISRKLSHEAAMHFSENYRSEIGSCKTDAEATPRQANSALDLFCHLEDIYDPTKPDRHRSANPHQENLPHDEDVIPAEHHANAKQESSAHIARQGGQPHQGGPVHPVAPMRTINQAQQDNSAESQNEFKLQLERQAKHAGGGAAAAASPAVAAAPVLPAPPAPPALPIQPVPPAAAAPAVTGAKDQAKPGTPAAPAAQGAAAEAPAAQAPAQAVLPNHNSFTKQPPPKAVEDPKAEAAQEKGTGW